MISTKGRYALRVMIDLAQHEGEGNIPLKDIAERQDISKKYLEIIVKDLVKGGMLNGVSGKGGGYSLSRKAEEYTVGEIIELMEGTLAPRAARWASLLRNFTPADLWDLKKSALSSTLLKETDRSDNLSRTVC